MARPWFFVLLALAGGLRASAQTPPNRYVVFTFEERYKISPHRTQTYYWIQPLDSVAATPVRLAALLLGTFSKDNLDDICQGRPTDPFLVKASTMYGFPDEYAGALEALPALIEKHRTRIQTIRKSWLNGQSSITQVYATPITGRFCVAPLRRMQSDGDVYEGPLFIPFADFQALKDLSGPQLLKQMGPGADFSQVHYAIFPSSHRK